MHLSRNKVYRLLFITFILSIWARLLSAQNGEHIEIKVYGFEEGLSHRNVFKIAQDPEGFIWIATVNGLNKFDGHNILQYSSNSPDYQIPFDYISDMVIDEDSILWMANPNYLTMLRSSREQTLKIKADSNSVVYDQPRTFNSLGFDENNNILLNTQLSETGASFIQRLSPEGLLTDFVSCKGTYAKRAVLQHQGSYYISYDENRLLQTDGAGNPVMFFDFPDRVKGLPSAAWINDMQVGENGKIWVLFNNGQVYYKDSDEEAFTEHPVTAAIFNRGISTAFLIEPNGDIWIGGLGNLWFYEAASGAVYNYDQQIRDMLKNTCNYRQIFKDDSGVIWVASDYGAIKLIRSEENFTCYLGEGSEFCSNGFCSMRGITEDEQGNIYFSYYNSIHVLDARTNSLRPLFPQNDYFNFPFGLAYHDQALYTGNGRRIDLQTLEVDTLFNDEVIDLGSPLVDHENEIWLGFRNALYIYNPTSKKIRNFIDPAKLIDTSKLDISYLYQSPSDSSIWLCTLEDGVYQIKKGEGVLKHINQEMPDDGFKLRHNKVNGIFEDADKNLWLGTGNGLHKWDFEKKTTRVYDSKTGLANNFINGLLAEGDTSIWVSTDNGLARIDLQNDQVSLFFKQDGLSANEFNRVSFYKSRDGRMFFGGLSGINAFYPSRDLANRRLKRNCKILFSGFSKLDGESDSIINRKSGLSPQQPIRLSYKDKFFSFEFALANFNNPAVNTYSYMLEGYEKDWSKPSQVNVARYNNIPAGNYTFRVRAASGPGNWNEEELSLKVEVAAAFYKSWWFIGICFLGALASVAGILEYRLYRSIKRERELEREVKARTLELEHEKRKSDELLLNILPSETAEELKKFGKAKAKRYDHVTVLFTDFKGFTKIAEQLTPEELVAEIDFCFRNFDAIIEKHGLEKIKTIGDAYMCAGGIPKPDVNNPKKVIEAALDIRDFMLRFEQDRKKEGRLFFEIRLGVHTGDVVSGIVGTKKFVYDIWGDAVNIAARMEDNSDEGKVNISGTTYELVKDNFTCEYRGKIAAKNKGEVDMYFVERNAKSNGSPSNLR